MVLISEEEKDGKTYEREKRPCGFILSTSDGIILSAGLILTWFVWGKVGEFSFFIPFVLGHFFLFCNVFRIRRKQELLWAATFIINGFIWSALGRYSIFILFGLQILLTGIILILEMTRPDYHGIFCRNINKQMDDYLA